MVFLGLSRALGQSSSVSKALEFASHSADFSLAPGLNAPLLATLLERRSAMGGSPAVLAITPTSRESDALHNALGALTPAAQVVTFPAWETLPHERLSPSAEIVGARFDALRTIATWNRETPLVVLASVRAALQPLASNLLDVDALDLAVHARGFDLHAISARLVDLAYTRVDMVARRGEFAVRGGILDVFAPTAEHPYRIDFFGDEVDSISYFSVADQRSLAEPLDRVVLGPSRELLLTPAVRQRAAEMQHEFPNLEGMLAKIAEGIPVEGMESLTPALVDSLVPSLTSSVLIYRSQ